MASIQNKHPENTPGELFVDDTCINCDTCRQLAPDVFADTGDHSYVQVQPASGQQTRLALRALLACPTGSIGTARANQAGRVKEDFPLLLDQGVYYMGFTSENSFGGSSYLLETDQGNWLIDSPRYSSYLVKRLEELGGLQHIFLTHRDDVADAAKYAKRFGAARTIHRWELSAQPDAERVIEGFDPVELAPGLLAIPTPGHTRGHCALLYGNRYLFSGDHIWW
ncbi:MAG: MBL fold metallo-hydrolase, partial [bacterium]|nr:MBL fold metallo-hydrolase [bacterium]